MNFDRKTIYIASQLSLYLTNNNERDLIKQRNYMANIINVLIEKVIYTCKLFS